MYDCGGTVSQGRRLQLAPGLFGILTVALKVYLSCGHGGAILIQWEDALSRFLADHSNTRIMPRRFLRFVAIDDVLARLGHCCRGVGCIREIYRGLLPNVF